MSTLMRGDNENFAYHMDNINIIYLILIFKSEATPFIIKVCTKLTSKKVRDLNSNYLAPKTSHPYHVKIM